MKHKKEPEFCLARKTDPPGAGYGVDYKLDHVCYLDKGHKGPHRCKLRHTVGEIGIRKCRRTW